MNDPERIAIIPAHPGEEVAVIWDETNAPVIVPVVAWRIMFTPETDDGPATYVAYPIIPHFSIDMAEYQYALRLPDGHWLDSLYYQLFDSADEFLKWYREP